MLPTVTATVDSWAAWCLAVHSLPVVGSPVGGSPAQSGAGGVVGNQKVLRDARGQGMGFGFVGISRPFCEVPSDKALKISYPQWMV